MLRYIDDLLLVGPSDKTADAYQYLQKLVQDAGLKLNQEKVQYNPTTIEWLGAQFHTSPLGPRIEINLNQQLDDLLTKLANCRLNDENPQYKDSLLAVRSVI